MINTYLRYFVGALLFRQFGEAYVTFVWSN